MNIEKLEQLFKTLESINPHDDLAYERAILAFHSIGYLPIFIWKYPYKRFFRTRTHITAEYFKKISDVGITPKEFVKDFARCNTPGQSVFYSSEDIQTSYMELIDYWSENKKIGEKMWVTIGEWETNKQLDLIVVASPENSNRESKYDKIHGEAYDNEYKSKTKEEQEFARVFFNYLFQKFRKYAKHDPKTYIITTAYCNLALLIIEKLNLTIDGITYPSVPFENQGNNVVIKRKCFKDNLKLITAYYSEFNIISEDGKHHFVEANKRQSSKVDILQNSIYW